MIIAISGPAAAGKGCPVPQILNAPSTNYQLNFAEWNYEKISHRSRIEGASSCSRLRNKEFAAGGLTR